MCGGSKTRIGLLGIALAIALAINPAAAPGPTVENGSFTAAPGERNLLTVRYEAGTDSYKYLDSVAITDGDGAGGCSVAPATQATCPAASVGAISISLGDGDDEAKLTDPSTYLTCDAPFVNLGASIGGGDGNDQIFGGGGNDIVSGGLGNDIISGSKGDDTLQGGEGFDQIQGNGGADRLDRGPGPDRVDGIEHPQCTGSLPTPGLPLEQQVPDVLACGTGGGGDDASDIYTTPNWDGANLGATDQVSIDCEVVTRSFTCPPVAIPVTASSTSRPRSPPREAPRCHPLRRNMERSGGGR